MTIVRYSLDGVPSGNSGIYTQLKQCWSNIGMNQPLHTSGRKATVCFEGTPSQAQLIAAQADFWNLVQTGMPAGAHLDHFWLYTGP